MRRIASALLLGACGETLAEHDAIYSHGAEYDVLCAYSIDDKYERAGEIPEALDRAAADGTTLHLYTHEPGLTVSLSTIELVLAGAMERGLAFQTYGALGDGKGVALGFDDRDVTGWHSLRPLFDAYDAKVTFFVSHYQQFTELEKQQLAELAGDGHDIEYHSTNHRDATLLSAELGVDGYLADDIAPALELMRADGYAPTVFAYPFGERTAETDAALLEQFVTLRAIASTCPR